MHMRIEPSFFLTRRTGAPNGLVEGAYVSRGEIFFNLALCFLELGWCLTVEAAWRDLVIGDEVDGVMNAIWGRRDGRELIWECGWESFEEAGFEVRGDVGR